MALQKHVADRIHQVTDAFTNWFIVEDGGLRIVDTGFPRSWASLEDALQQLRRRPSDIEAVVQTHGHFDHMGFTRRAEQELGVPVLAHEREARPWSRIRGAITTSSRAPSTRCAIRVSSRSLGRKSCSPPATRTVIARCTSRSAGR